MIRSCSVTVRPPSLSSNLSIGRIIISIQCKPHPPKTTPELKSELHLTSDSSDRTTGAIPRWCVQIAASLLRALSPPYSPSSGYTLIGFPPQSGLVRPCHPLSPPSPSFAVGTEAKDGKRKNPSSARSSDVRCAAHRSINIESARKQKPLPHFLQLGPRD